MLPLEVLLFGAFGALCSFTIWAYLAQPNPQKIAGQLAALGWSVDFKKWSTGFSFSGNKDGHPWELSYSYDPSPHYLSESLISWESRLAPPATRWVLLVEERELYAAELARHDPAKPPPGGRVDVDENLALDKVKKGGQLWTCSDAAFSQRFVVLASDLKLAQALLDEETRKMFVALFPTPRTFHNLAEWAPPLWFSADKIVIRANRYGKLKPELGDKLIRLGTRLRARYESLGQV